MRRISISLPDHLYQILELCAMEEGKDLRDFAKDGLLGYCRDMGYLTIFDEINKNLRETNTRI